MTGGRILLLAMGGLGVVWLIVSTGAPDKAPANEEWRVIGGFPDGEKTKFVEMKPENAKDRQVYDNAVRNICREETHCSVAFFLRGDPAPLNQTSAFFYRSLGSGTGGWQNPEYRTLAFWRQNRVSGLAEYMSWDCDRAGAEGSPTSALCGPGVKEAYSAVMALAGRANTAKACSWPKTDDANVALAYIDKIREPARQEQFKKAFNLMSSGKGPDDRADCTKLRAKIEASAKAARKTLGF